MALIGLSSRFNNFFDIRGHVLLEHFVTGFGLSAFFTLLLCTIVAIYFKTSKTSAKHNLQLIYISLAGASLSLFKAISWEFFSSENTSNQFSYDSIGIALYLLTIAILFKGQKTFNEAKVHL